MDEQISADSDLAVLARFGMPWPAEILCARLRAEGIQASLPDQNMVATNALFANAIGGVRVMVPKPQLNRAREIMAAIERGEFALTDEDFDEAPESPQICPRCNSTDVRQDDTRKRRALAAVFLLGIPLPFSRKDKCCGHCGHRWR